jgi:phosphoglycerate dehydrogenase-like enzyme
MTTNDKPALKILAGFPEGLVSYDDFAPFITVPVDWTDFNDLSTEEFEAVAPDFDVAVGLAGLLQPANVSLMTGLRAAISGTVGYSQMERSSLPVGCDFVLTFGHEFPIADWVMLAMLALSRDTIRVDRGFRDTTIPSAKEQGMPKDLYGSTVAIIGLGRIGKRVVHLAKAHDMRCISATRTVPDDESVTALGLDYAVGIDRLHDVLSEADHVVITAPLNDETEGMIGTSEYAVMKNSAFLINVTRGALLDEDATFEALKSEDIAGAALDVWWDEGSSSEPTGQRWSTRPFWELDNVIMSPHWCSVTDGMIRRKLEAAGAQIDKVFNGEPLDNSVLELSRVGEVFPN